MTNSDFSHAQGENLRALRKARGLTIRQLADKVTELSGDSISASYVGAWERGERTISSENLMYLSQSLACPYAAFYEGIDYRVTENSETEIILCAFKALPNWARGVLVSINRVLNGDTLVLIRLLEVCYLFLPRKYRQEVIAMALHQCQLAVKNGDAPPGIERELNKLWEDNYK